jgi:hypothetical protein
MALDNEHLPYWATRSMKAGTSLSDQLREAITKCGICVFIATQSSIESKWCLAETGAFWGAGKRIVLYKATPDINLPPLFQGDLWTCDIREVIQQVREFSAQPKDEEFRVNIEVIRRGYLSAQASGFDPFIEKSKDALLEYKHLLDGMGQGYMLTEVGGKYSYGRRGAMAAKKTVKAIEYENIDAWRTEHLKDVIRANSAVIQRGVQIQRVFILQKESITSAKDVLDSHKKAGAQVFIVSPEELPNTQLLESYLIVDESVLVVFYFTRDGKHFREERISINQIEVNRAVSGFNSIFRRATVY